MIDTATLTRLLNVFRPDTNLTQKTAKLLAADLRKAAARCDELAAAPADQPPTPDAPTPGPPAKRQKGRFDFTRFAQRYVVLRLFYVGWRYHGFASQEHEGNTVEGHLFRALERTCLLPPHSVWSDVGYTRCGRTDVGVSALHQVLTIRLRSKAPAGRAPPSPAQELDYPFILNKVLPDDIQVTGWRPAEAEFHARFSCRWREYNYFIAGVGQLDVAAMQAAAANFEGEHNFQNFCKMNLANTTQHVRRVVSATVAPVPLAYSGRQDVVVFTVRGTSFLWHQVRYMVAVLLMVGCRVEDPAIVTQLLDVEAHPRKPQYHMVPETPLLLAGTGFDDLGELPLSHNAAAHVLRKLSRLTEDCEVRLAMMHTIRDAVRAVAPAGDTAAPADGVWDAANSAGPSARGASAACGHRHACGPQRDGGAAACGAPEASDVAVAGADAQADPAAQQSKRDRKRSGLHVLGVPHIKLLQRATEPSFAERLAALRARGGTESVSQAQLRAMQDSAD